MGTRNPTQYGQSRPEETKKCDKNWTGCLTEKKDLVSMSGSDSTEILKKIRISLRDWISDLPSSAKNMCLESE